jgi:hypothetical protein
MRQQVVDARPIVRVPGPFEGDSDAMHRFQDRLVRLWERVEREGEERRERETDRRRVERVRFFLD